jgi:chromosomal replication initiation ATPase DnaA
VRRNESRCQIQTSLDEIIARVCHEYGLSEAELTAGGRGRVACEARGVVGYLSARTRCATLTAAAKRLGRDVATISRATQALAARSRTNATQGTMASRVRAVEGQLEANSASRLQ